MIAVPEPVTLLGAMLPQVRPEGRVSVRLTTPEKWLTLVTVIVALAELPALAGLGELAVMVKF
jgi:hypothetical protein